MRLPAISQKLVKILSVNGISSFILDGDALRTGINKDVGQSTSGDKTGEIICINVAWGISSIKAGDKSTLKEKHFTNALS
ncbi:adenylyl-sulfate kinase [Polynucleobacter sphagniphilus]|uniref:adenylyl-sulfate kinase n=1 Tax=Polynucleobacter sphagniphilus TaxID=1743169 RepID=UPI00247E83F4|nr:adenylylsulfate kinase-like enzyme [Polynucleobacter sphagniphilus]